MASPLSMVIFNTELSNQNERHFESYCTCSSSTSKGMRNDYIRCRCGEDCGVYEWSWDETNVSRSATMTGNKRDVLFHKTFSSGTAAVRGNKPLQQNCHHYWEIKMMTTLYGTDVMVGVGTEAVDLHLWPYRFCSLLGQDAESWGYSYRGSVQHNAKRKDYGPRFGRGSLVGVHLDLVAGTIEFYVNRRPLGVAFTGLKGKKLYPMVSSTAAQSAIRVTCSLSTPQTLQMLAIKHVKESEIPAGLKRLLHRRFWWLLGEPRSRKRKRHPVARNDDETDDER